MIAVSSQGPDRALAMESPRLLRVNDLVGAIFAESRALSGIVVQDAWAAKYTHTTVH